MTTFAELYAATLEHTKRPELQGITETAVRTAVLRAHHVDFFSRDLKTGILTYTISNSAQFYDFSNVSVSLAQMRTISHIYEISETGQPVAKLDFCAPDDMLDECGQLRRGVYHLIGDTLRAYTLATTGRVEVYYYANPVMSGTTVLQSWIADAYKDEVARWAAAIVFTRSGFIEMANKYNDDYIKPFKDMLVQSHMQDLVN